MSNNGPIQGQSSQGTSPFSQYNKDALDKADKTDVIRIQGNKIKVGASEGSFLNRKVRKRLGNFSSKMRASYESHAQKATQNQREAAFAKMRAATNNRYHGTSLNDRQVTVADARRLLFRPDIPDDVLNAIKSTSSNQSEANSAVFEALNKASESLHEGKKLGIDKATQKDLLVGGARFNNIYAPEATAIKVEITDENGSIESTPMHANRVGGSFIAAQAPLFWPILTI